MAAFISECLISCILLILSLILLFNFYEAFKIISDSIKHSQKKYTVFATCFLLLGYLF
jgi:hypothetical protein